MRNSFGFRSERLLIRAFEVSRHLCKPRFTGVRAYLLHVGKFGALALRGPKHKAAQQVKKVLKIESNAQNNHIIFVVTRKVAARMSVLFGRVQLAIHAPDVVLASRHQPPVFGGQLRTCEGPVGRDT